MLKRIITVLAASAVVCGALKAVSDIQNRPMPVSTCVLCTTTVTNSVNCTGALRAVRACTLGAPLNTVADKIYVRVGDDVKAGQLLMTYSQCSNLSLPDADILSEIAGSGFLSGGWYNASELFNGSGYIEAPFDGKITAIPISEGEQISSFGGAVQVCDTSRMLAILRVSESDVSRLSEGMPVTFRGDSFSGVRKGVVTAVSPAVTTRTSLTGTNERYCEVTAELLDTEDINPGASVKAQISVSRISDAIIVPYSAIGQDDAGEYVFIMENGTAKRRYITTAEDLGDSVRLSSGVLSGETLILTAPDKLTEGERVTDENS